MIEYLQLRNVGPSSEMRFEPGKRLNLVTGDNGLGKSFLLDVSWWALTRTWASMIALPTQHKTAVIEYVIHGKAEPAERHPDAQAPQAGQEGEAIVIPVGRVAKPRGYDAVKRSGDAWLRANPHAKRPKDLWSPYLSHLANGFSHRCGYAAMLDPTGGSVDHYLSWHQHPDLAYDWSNFRFVSSILNASKRTADDAVLDPYQVQRGWFEILLPSLQMRLTSKVPAKHRAKAEHTLERLKLRDGEKLIRWRRHYYDAYQQGKLDLDGLRAWAPLIAEAVERTQFGANTRRKHGTQRQRRRATRNGSE